jgi:hypothetical protein
VRLLFDQNLSFKLCRQLADLFPESSAAVEGMARVHKSAIAAFEQDVVAACLEIY